MIRATDPGSLAPLRGMAVVVTRPAHQADRLCRLIEDCGGEAVRFPVLEILPPEDLAGASAVIDSLEDYDMAIFASANAVERGLGMILQRRELPPGLSLVAIGKGTARELERWGRGVYLCPDQGFTSEALLALPEMRQVAGRRIVIFRGQGGRELLAEVLRERGAGVSYAEVYRRAKPKIPPDDLLRRWAQQGIQAVIVTSAESLLNLFEIVGEGGQQWLRSTPLIVVSGRIQALAQRLGFNQPALIAREASDEAIVEALLGMAPSPIRVTSGEL